MNTEIKERPKIEDRDRRRREQVDLKLQREISRKISHGKCSLCCLSIKYCICNDLATLPTLKNKEDIETTTSTTKSTSLVFISLVVSAYERERASSTHKLVLATLGPTRCNLYISDGTGYGGANEIWLSIYKQAKNENRRVCFLWPGEGSISFRDFIQQKYHHHHLYKQQDVDESKGYDQSVLETIKEKRDIHPSSFSTSSSYPSSSSSSSPLPPPPSSSPPSSSPSPSPSSSPSPPSSPQKFLVIAFDGTWPNARKSQRDIELAALTLSSYQVERCFVDNSIVSRYALFSPLRRQPTIDRVSTLEACACCFDEVAIALRNKTLSQTIENENDIENIENITSTFPTLSTIMNDVESSTTTSTSLINTTIAHEIIDDQITSNVINDKADKADDTLDIIHTKKGKEIKKYDTTTTTTGKEKNEEDVEAVDAVDAEEDVEENETRLKNDTLEENQNQHPHEEILPACSSYISRTLRYNLLVLVDSLLREKGLISPKPHCRGIGYRTWKLPSTDVGPNFGKLSAHLIEKIATFAYGKSSVYQSGFVARGPKKKNETHWKSIFSTSEGKCENTNGNGDESTRKHKETILNEKPSPELFKRLCQGGLPSKCIPYNTTSFALTNSHLYVLFSGYVKFVDKKREKRMNNKKEEEEEGICKD